MQLGADYFTTSENKEEEEKKRVKNRTIAEQTRENQFGSDRGVGLMAKESGMCQRMQE